MDLNLGKENFKGKWPNWMEVHVAFEKMMKAFDKVKAAQLKRQKKDACGQSACTLNKEDKEMENVINKSTSKEARKLAHAAKEKIWSDAIFYEFNVKPQIIKEEKIKMKALKEILIEQYMRDDDYNEYDAELCANNDIEHDYNYWAREYADDIPLYAKA